MRVLITGANRGIGQGLLAHYAAQPETVAFGTVRSTPADDALIQLDVTCPEGFTDLAARFHDVALDLLVCNAGVYPDKGMTLDTKIAPDIWSQAFSVNVTGVWMTIEALLPALQRAKTPRIAIISSIMGSSERAPGGSYVYRASKAAVTNLGRNLAVDLAPKGISVGMYHPGWVRTDMGGSSADISRDASVAGLTARFAALGPETSGVFESYDGTPIPF